MLLKLTQGAKKNHLHIKLEKRGHGFKGYKRIHAFWGRTQKLCERLLTS